jgi:hypothetical protein
MTGLRKRIPGPQAVSWQASNRMFLRTFAGSLAAVYLFILLIDPYGVVPFSPRFHRPIMSSQRQIYPQILRTGRYDSIVVGTSTVRLLDPAALARVFGGHFANLAMPSTTAWEQVQVIDFFRRTVAAPKALLIGLDHEWCNRSGRAAAVEGEFPAWAYDGNRWDGLFHLLNNPTLETAGRTVGRLLGWMPEKLRDDGFEVFVGPDSAYDLARARAHLYAPLPAPLQEQTASAGHAGHEAGRDAMTSETMQWLDDSLAALPAATRKILVFPPLHAHSLPPPGSPAEARYAGCKQRAAAIARRHGALLVDWRIASPLTKEDTHFWDPLHYRLPVAYGLIDDLAHVVNEGRESPDGSYHILVR